MRKWGSFHRPEHMPRGLLVPKASSPPHGEYVMEGWAMPRSERSECQGRVTHGPRAPSPSSVSLSSPANRETDPSGGPQAPGLVPRSGGVGGQFGDWVGDMNPGPSLNLTQLFRVGTGLSSPGAVCLCVQILSLRERGARGLDTWIREKGVSGGKDFQV